MVTTQNFVETLKTAGDVKEHWAFIDGLLRDNRFEAIEEIGRRMVSECAFEMQDWAARSVFEYLLTGLAHADDEGSLRAVFSALPSAGSSVSSRFVEGARADVTARLACVHSLETIEKILPEVADLETAGLLLHEAIVRGKIIGATPASVGVYNRLKEKNHPLAWLPLELLHCETDLPLRSYARTGSGWGFPEAPQPFFQIEIESESPNRTFSEVMDEVRVGLIGSADQDWRDHSNGKNEVRIFCVGPFGQFSFEKTLPTLGLESAGRDLKVEENVSPIGVFQHLFGVSANGGAYSRGCRDAYGRLNAWKSLAGLCGCTLDLDAEEILETAMACRWGKFQGGEWFYDIFWDLGVVCLNPDRSELVVLAATDVD